MLVLSGMVAIKAQGPPPGPMPSCELPDFCGGRCSNFNASEKHNLTVYRMSPFGVYDLADKDTGDVAGDMEFVLTQKEKRINCHRDPTSSSCQELTQFDGDEANSTDLVIEFQIEVDGNWGQYLLCNPVNTSNPKGEWLCDTSIPRPPGAALSSKCTQNGWALFPYRCYGSGNWAGSYMNITSVSNGSACCDLANAAGANYWSYRPMGNQTCSLFSAYASESTDKESCTSAQRDIFPHSLCNDLGFAPQRECYGAWAADVHIHNVDGMNASGCCAEASAAGATAYTQFPGNNTCALFTQQQQSPPVARNANGCRSAMTTFPQRWPVPCSEMGYIPLNSDSSESGLAAVVGRAPPSPPDSSCQLSSLYRPFFNKTGVSAEQCCTLANSSWAQKWIYYRSNATCQFLAMKAEPRSLDRGDRSSSSSSRNRNRNSKSDRKAVGPRCFQGMLGTAGEGGDDWRLTLPPACTAAGYVPETGGPDDRDLSCFVGTPSKVVTNVSAMDGPAECCDSATKYSSTDGAAIDWTYFALNASCSLFHRRMPTPAPTFPPPPTPPSGQFRCENNKCMKTDDRTGGSYDDCKQVCFDPPHYPTPKPPTPEPHYPTPSPPPRYATIPSAGCVSGSSTFPSGCPASCAQKNYACFAPESEAYRRQPCYRGTPFRNESVSSVFECVNLANQTFAAYWTHYTGNSSCFLFHNLPTTGYPSPSPYHPTAYPTPAPAPFVSCRSGYYSFSREYSPEERPPRWTEQCTILGYLGLAPPAESGSCYVGHVFKQTIGKTLSDCCSSANRSFASYYSFYPGNATCQLLSPSRNATTGYITEVRSISPPPLVECVSGHSHVQPTIHTCPLLTQSVGRSPRPLVAHTSGYWYSHPRAGMCKDGERPSPTSNCSWRVLSRSRVINASCMYARIDSAVEAAGADCFGQCTPNERHNTSSPCYEECYLRAQSSMSGQQLMAPWKAAFAGTKPEHGGCPEVVA